MTIVMITCLTVILYLTCKICINKFLYITATSADYLNSLRFKHILGPLTHIAGQHDLYSHLSEHWSDSAFASATFRRSHPADICHISVNDIEYCIVCAMSEVIIHSSISCRYSYLHNPNKKKYSTNLTIFSIFA